MTDKQKELRLEQEELVELGFALIPESKKPISLHSAIKRTAYECPECGNKIYKGVYSPKEFDHYITDGIVERFRRCLFFNPFLMIRAEPDTEPEQ